MHHFLMNHLTSEGQVSDPEPRSLVRGYLPLPGMKEVIHRQNQLRIDQWSMTGFDLLNCHSLSRLCQSSGPGLEVS